MKQELLPQYNQVIFTPFKIRNQIINEDRLGRDINNFAPKQQLKVLQSYMPVSEIKQRLVHQKQVNAEKARRYLNYLKNSHKSNTLNCGFFMGNKQNIFGGFDLTGLKAYYKFNEFYLSSPNYSDNFSTDNWTDQGTKIQVNTGTNSLDFLVDTRSTNYQSVYDLGAGNVSDTVWSLKYKITYTTVTQTSSGTSSFYFLFGISSANQTIAFDNVGVGQDFLGLQDLISPTTGGNQKEHGIVGYDSSGPLDNPATPTFSRVLATETLYMIQNRISATLFKITFQDSDGLTLEQQTKTVASTVSSLRYLKAGNGYIGSQNATPTLQGTIQELSFYNAVSPVLHNYSTSPDSLTTNADGSLNGNLSVVAGKIGNAYDFNGSTTYCELGSSVSQWNFMHNTTALWSVAFWMKLDAASVSKILLNFNDSGHGVGFVIAQDSLQDLVVAIDNGTNYVVSKTTTSNYIPDTTNWYFYTITYDQSLGSTNLKIRRNDANEETANKTTQTPSNSNAANALQMARRFTGDRYLNAKLDEMSIWNRVLTAAEITSLYNSGNGMEIK